MHSIFPDSTPYFSPTFNALMTDEKSLGGTSILDGQRGTSFVVGSVNLTVPSDVPRTPFKRCELAPRGEGPLPLVSVNASR